MTPQDQFIADQLFSDIQLNVVEETLIEFMIGTKTDPKENNIDRIYEAIETIGLTQRPPKGSNINLAEFAYIVLCDALLKKEGWTKQTTIH